MKTGPPSPYKLVVRFSWDTWNMVFVACTSVMARMIEMMTETPVMIPIILKRNFYQNLIEV